MPDLDQIKQAEQERGTGAGGFPRPVGHPAGRPRGSATASTALPRLLLVGDPAALRLCLADFRRY